MESSSVRRSPFFSRYISRYFFVVAQTTVHPSWMNFFFKKRGTTLMEQAHFKQVLSYKCGHLIGICNSCQAQWLYLKFIAGVDKRGEVGSLRITLTLIWLFYPLAWQRTKCIDSIRITPPVSGTHFIHPTAINTVHYGPHANISTFLVTARTEKAVLVRSEELPDWRGVTGPTPEKEEKREINKRVKGQMEYRHFSLWSAVLTCSRHPWQSW